MAFLVHLAFVPPREHTLFNILLIHWLVCFHCSLIGNYCFLFVKHSNSVHVFSVSLPFMPHPYNPPKKYPHLCSVWELYACLLSLSLSLLLAPSSVYFSLHLTDAPCYCLPWLFSHLLPFFCVAPPPQHVSHSLMLTPTCSLHPLPHLHCSSFKYILTYIFIMRARQQIAASCLQKSNFAYL